ncbi:DNA mismatch repair protein MutS [Thalassobacillus sp. CUG 92003]|uniref:DNA mismatch repair protein MutS n=1 Tax=Thalassobacillus sp. CUG 92003 TaxID=2736641 RepID=UPI0015E641B1|nr:DNA mismatch repair protein MutS [Thalassobacillus sp. CUG 92003]
MAQHTPMMQQYISIKSEHQDAFLFFRLGDFYEMFYDDALQAAQELEITLTSRDGGDVPMCGVPYHSAENYIKQLIERGYKVAICEQVEDPKEAKGVVKREVVQLITPGTVMEGSMLEEKENNYLASVTSFNDGTFTVAYNDLTTGENTIAFIPDGWDAVLGELYNRPVKEVVVAPDFAEDWQVTLRDRLGYTVSFQEEVEIDPAFEHLCVHLHQDKYKIGFGRLFNYIQTTQKRTLDHLRPVTIIELNHFMTLDMYTKRNLEIMETIRKQGRAGSLLWVIDATVTSMGARQLKKWLERPLLSQTEIERRHRQVEGFLGQFLERDELRQQLKSVYDLERLAGRIAFGNVNARDLLQLKQSLQEIPMIRETLMKFEHPDIKAIAQSIESLESLARYLEDSIHDQPPVTIKEGGLIKDRFHAQLDEYRSATKNGKQWIAELEQKERQATNIKSLKVGFNRVFGYYIEVTKANLRYLPEGRYERKQTLTNAERFITPELKEKESLILEAEDKIVQLEYELFLEIREYVKSYISSLQHLAASISQLDVLQGFAEVADQHDYVQPTFNQARTINIEQGRHPVVERVMNDASFVPNDVLMDESSDLLLITGPNMSGKSTYMRQLALTAIMAQIGCFVPCTSASIPVFDQVFTRIGAADDLVSGQSTFMVEMLEAKHALSHATENSMILLDEIGRGTSTYDGMALAQAIVEHIHEHIRAKTLFSTHYHELTGLSDHLQRLRNIHVRAEEYEGKVVFLHQIQEGAADESYGIHVAQLADLPDTLIARATELLQQFEKESARQQVHTQDDEGIAEQMTMFKEDVPKPAKQQTSQIDKHLQSLNLMEMTPMEAMNELYRLQKEANSK